VVSEAMLSLGRLDQAGRQIPNPGLLRRPTLRREAQSTSALEGTYAPLSEVLEVDPDDAEPASRSPELREVLNYVRAAEYAYEAVKERGITVGLLLDVHRLLVAGTRADGSMAGAVRDHQVVIGPPGSRVTDARFVPPPPGSDLEIALREWAQWVQGPSELPVVVRAALAHYQFEVLHPFNDGNGRIGRLVIVLQLLREGVLREPLLTVSPWFEARRREYQDRLGRLSENGDWDDWVAFFSSGVAAQAASTTEKVGQLLAYQEESRARARAHGLRGLAIDLVDSLIARPILTTGWVAAGHNVSRQAATTAIARLVDAGILVETTGRSYGRVFAAEAVIRILER
ncbi:MAG: Fic family protein, partial [Actinobacteria bacterium]|nr:Fic family protein [Actinomycetota bacterium]